MAGRLDKIWVYLSEFIYLGSSTLKKGSSTLKKRRRMKKYD